MFMEETCILEAKFKILLYDLYAGVDEIELQLYRDKEGSENHRGM
jgi:hypothetical protein